MSHHQFGTIAGLDGEGTFGLAGSVLLDEQDVLAVQRLKDDGPKLPVIAVQLVGRVAGSEDTFQGVFVCSVLDAGALARMLADAAGRIGGVEGAGDFSVGFAIGADE